MTSKRKPSNFERIIQLVSDASLSFGFAKGTGLGAVLLAIIALIVLIQGNGSLDGFRSLLVGFGEAK
ncbi:MAG: hypothetical protein KDK53_20920 [Maritimibacter sp.]|nr:hypothetical protein [Maritimibacter sp.]